MRSFKYWNDAAFGSSLGPIPIRITKARSYNGQFRVKTILRNGRKSYHPSIAISTFLDNSEDKIVDTLIHEMIHFYIWVNKIQDTSAHGNCFRRMMNDINRRFGRHITISTKVSAETQRSVTTSTVSAIAVCSMKDGRRLICVPARTRIKEVYHSLRNWNIVESVDMYVSTDSRLTVYPRIRTAKLYQIDQNTLDEIIAGAVKASS